MKKMLSLLALVCALTFVPLSTAKAGTVVYDHRPEVPTEVVVYYGPGPRYARWYPHPLAGITVKTMSGRVQVLE